MLGIVLLYVGGVLFINGIAILGKIDAKSSAIMNFFTGGLALLIDIMIIFKASTTVQYYAAGTGLLFAFTYLYVALTTWFDLDGSGLGWYCLFVAINTIPAAILSFIGNDLRFGVIWLIWGFLWFLFFLANGAKKQLGKLLPYATLVIGIATAWIPGFMMLTDKW